MAGSTLPTEGSPPPSIFAVPEMTNMEERTESTRASHHQCYWGVVGLNCHAFRGPWMILILWTNVFAQVFHIHISILGYRGGGPPVGIIIPDACRPIPPNMPNILLRSSSRHRAVCLKRDQALQGALELGPTSFGPLTTVTAIKVRTILQLLYSMKSLSCLGTRYLTISKLPATYMSTICFAFQSVLLFQCMLTHLCGIWLMLFAMWRSQSPLIAAKLTSSSIRS